MLYDLQVEDVSSIRRRLRFTLAGDVVKSELDRAFVELRDRVKLAGFRPGKVPRTVLEARFGKQIRSDVGAKLIERSYAEAAANLDVAGQPAIEQRGEVAVGADFSFTIAVDVKPQIEVTGYQGMKVTYPTTPLADDAVENAIKRELSRKARIEELTEDRPVQEGDFVLASIKLVAGDEVLADEPGTMLNTRAERYYPGVEQVAIGLSKGGSHTATVTIGSGAELKHLAGVEVEATVTVINVQVHKVPDLNDETAAELGYEGGADGMRGAVAMKLQEQLDDAARNQARVNLLQQLVTGNPVDVPKALVDEQFQLLVEELRVRRAYGGQDPRSIRFSDSEIADLRERAGFAARASVLLAAIARQENIAVSNDDLDDKIREIADLRGQAVEAIRGYLEREGAVEMLRNRILEERCLDWLMEQADLDAVDAASYVDPRDANGEDDSATQASAMQASAAQDSAEEPASAAQDSAEEPAADAPADDPAQSSEG